VDTPLNHGQFEELAAGWVLGALEPDDEQVFRRHLATCDRCEQSVRELEEVAGELAYAAPPVDPPPALWASIRGALGEAEPPGQVQPLRPRPRRVWPLRLAAAACILLLVALALWNVALRDQNDTYRQRVAALEEVAGLANDPTTRTVSLNATTPAAQGARVTVLASSRQDRGVLLVEGLRPAPPGRVYELWRLPEGKVADAQPAVVFLGSARVQSVPFSMPLQPTTGFAVTVEQGPRGSDKPTSQPVLSS
jgi:anti-sigma-K factor RskA